MSKSIGATGRPSTRTVFTGEMSLCPSQIAANRRIAPPSSAVAISRLSR